MTSQTSSRVVRHLSELLEPLQTPQSPPEAWQELGQLNTHGAGSATVVCHGKAASQVEVFECFSRHNFRNCTHRRAKSRPKSRRSVHKHRTTDTPGFVPEVEQEVVLAEYFGDWLRSVAER
ncbi:hypothetical protein Bbelb_047240 [Branchiostoma belcheri]|nr:hypothetical protein Bbelb_047240 [Branchiostoma belcheri]